MTCQVRLQLYTIFQRMRSSDFRDIHQTLLRSHKMRFSISSSHLLRSSCSRRCFGKRALPHNDRASSYTDKPVLGQSKAADLSSLSSFCRRSPRTMLLFTPSQGTMPSARHSNTASLSPSTGIIRREHGQTSVNQYVPPQTGLIARLPQSWIPYAELVRLDKPAGTYYLFFPCAFSTLLAATMAPSVSLIHVLGTTGLFFAGAMIMRGAGCAINDLWDRNLDPHVERTKFRPIARGAISPGKAVVFTGTQLLVGLGILLQFPFQCLWYGIPSLLLVGSYPLAKRVTYYPQAVLGLTFSWGAIMGFPALGVDLVSDTNVMMAAAALYSSCVSWTILYDMIYAHMDIKDDVAAGIKSIALRHEHNTKAVLSGLAIFQVALLAAAGVAAGAGPIFFVGSCGSAALTLGIMIRRVQLKSIQNCWWWFKNGCLWTGGGISLGMLLEYLAHVSGVYGKDERPQSSTELREQLIIPTNSIN